MPDLIKINTEDKIIEIDSFCDVTKEDIEASIAKVLQIYTEIGINRMLVNTTGQDSMPENIYSIYF